jgi:hypothetical protein
MEGSENRVEELKVGSGEVGLGAQYTVLSLQNKKTNCLKAQSTHSCHCSMFWSYITESNLKGQSRSHLARIEGGLPLKWND